VDGGGASHVLAALIAKVPEWAAALLAIAVSSLAVVYSLRGISGMFRGLLGPSDQQINAGIKQAVTSSVNGQLQKLSDKLDRLEEQSDERHAENQRAIGQLEGAFGMAIERRKVPRS